MGSGPSWSTDHVKASLTRISTAATADQANTQAVTEAVVLLHSLRRILIWTVVIVPLILVAAGIALAITAANTGSSSCSYSVYSSRC